MDKKLFEYLDNNIENILFRMENLKPCESTDIAVFKRKHAKYCYLCTLEFDVEKSKVVDHCHINEKFRVSICHNTCNLKSIINKKISNLYPNNSAHFKKL